MKKVPTPPIEYRWAKDPFRQPKRIGKVIIYFVECQATKLIKIGYTRNLSKRMRDLATMSPTKLELLARLSVSKTTAEGMVHDRFASDRDHGEWFRPSAALAQLITAINQLEALTK